MNRWTFILGLVVLAGCGPSDNKVVVNGMLLCDGKPLSGASIAFVGNNGGAYSSAVTDPDGKFTIRAAAGKNKVAVNKNNPNAAPPPDPNADQTMPTSEEATKIMKAAPKDLVAARFADPEKSGIVIDVSAGMSPVDISVTSK